MNKEQKEEKSKITLRSFVLGTLLCIVFAIVTVSFTHRRDLYVTATQIPTLPYALLFLSVLIINPLCRGINALTKGILQRVLRPFSVVELLVILTMGIVSSGISTFGLVDQLVPFTGSFYYEAWNNQQSKWDQHIAPFVNDSFFVAEDGLQVRAQDYQQKAQKTRDAGRIFDAALRLDIAEKGLVAAEMAVAEEAKAGAAVIDENARGPKSQAGVEVDTALDILKRTGREWSETLAGQGLSIEKDVVLESYPEMLKQYQEETKAAKDHMAELEKAANKKVELFRTGLPEGVGLRAYPGFVMTAEDTAASYMARISRLSDGRKSLKLVMDAKLEMDKDATAKAAVLLQQAADALAPIVDDQALQSEFTSSSQLLDEMGRRLATQGAEMEALYTKQREVERSELSGVKKELAEIKEKNSKLEQERNELESRKEKVSKEIEIIGRVKAVDEDLRALAGTVATMDRDEAKAALGVIADKYRLFDASVHRFLFGDVPWGHWARPMANWAMLIALTYMMLMTFNVLIFRQWAHNEKLVYPLADLSEQLAGAGEPDGKMPSLFSSGLFWSGAAVSGLMLGWNLLTYLPYIPGLTPLKFTNQWAPVIQNNLVLKALMPSARSEVFFSMIGLSFLVPKKISFSIWFFYVLYMIQLVVICSMGYGVNERSFAPDWWYTFNFRTAEGGGALMVFAIVMLWKCRKYLLCCIRPDVVKDLEADERKEMKISSLAFLVGSAGLIFMLSHGFGANFYATCFVYIVILLITIGIVRAVAEGGLLGFQLWASPFHFVKNVVGMDKAWNAPPLFAPLMVYFGVLFLDTKTFIAPAMANALKIRQDLRIKRSAFHLAMLLAIVVATVAATVVAIMMSYDKGGNQMEAWFYASFPRYEGFGKIAFLVRNPPVSDATQTSWIGVGALAMGALLYLRRFLFWIPHPIGLVMLASPQMPVYWFSIMLGWAAKSAITKYGSKDLYGKAKGFFIGLIFGELVIVVLAMLFTYLLEIEIPIDLNRNM